MGLTSKTAVNWHLKVKDIEFNVSLAKGYCISSIYKLIQKILGTHELNGHTPDFDHIHLKITETTLSFPEFSPACKKSSHSIQVILEIQSILESCDQADHTHL